MTTAESSRPTARPPGAGLLTWVSGSAGSRSTCGPSVAQLSPRQDCSLGVRPSVRNPASGRRASASRSGMTSRSTLNTSRPLTQSAHQFVGGQASRRSCEPPPSELRQPCTTSSGSENVPAPPVTRNTQRPSTGSFNAMMKKANPISPPAEASGSSYSTTSGSSSVGGLTSAGSNYQSQPASAPQAQSWLPGQARQRIGTARRPIR